MLRANVPLAVRFLLRLAWMFRSYSTPFLRGSLSGGTTATLTMPAYLLTFPRCSLLSDSYRLQKFT